MTNSTNSKHTPGPWHTGTGKAKIVVYDGEGQPVANASEYPAFSTRTHAGNARLIAAAPDLLEAAIRVLRGLNERIQNAPGNSVPVFDGIADLHAAIAKATGEAA